MEKGDGEGELAAMGGELKGSAPSFGGSGVVGRGVGSKDATFGMKAGALSPMGGIGGMCDEAKGEAPGSLCCCGGGDELKNSAGCCGGLKEGSAGIENGEAGAPNWAAKGEAAKAAGSAGSGGGPPAGAEKGEAAWLAKGEGCASDRAKGDACTSGLPKGEPMGGMAGKLGAASSGSVTGSAALESREVIPGPPACMLG